MRNCNGGYTFTNHRRNQRICLVEEAGQKCKEIKYLDADIIFSLYIESEFGISKCAIHVRLKEKKDKQQKYLNYGTRKLSEC